jgi:hypothetical protein
MGECGCLTRLLGYAVGKKPALGPQLDRLAHEPDQVSPQGRASDRQRKFAARSQLKWAREGDVWILLYRRRRMGRVVPDKDQHVAISQSRWHLSDTQHRQLD